MEKLIKLLNEYTKQSYDDYSFFRYIGPTHSFYISDDGYESYISEEVILSKRYGFIKWLVENDKIDRVQKTKEFRLQIELDNGSYGELGGEARLLMLLSISDTPIEDLISYLR